MKLILKKIKTYFRKIYNIKTISLIIVILLANHPDYSQVESKTQKMSNQNSKYGVIIELKINKILHFEDSLTISIIWFSHKKPYLGGPTKAMARLSISKGDTIKEVELSVHGIQGKSESEDGLSDFERYDSLVWMEYEFQLKKLEYDKAIHLVVSKKNE